MVIGFSQCTMVDEWRKTMVEEMQREISFYRNYNFTFIIKDAHDDNNQQIKDIKDLVKQGIDLLIVSPNEAQQLTSTVEEVFDKGIPVIVIDRKINSEKYTAYIGADNLSIGREAGYFASELLKGKGKILEITGLIGSTPAIERSKGFHEIIDKYPEINTTKIIEGAWLEDKTMKITDSLFYSFNDFNLIFAHNDFMAQAAAVTAKKHNIKTYIIGVDGLNTPKGGVNMVLEGSIDGTVLYPTGGEYAIQLAISILAGNTYEKNTNLSTYRIDKTNSRTIWLQGEQIRSQQQKIDKQVSQLDTLSFSLKRQNAFLVLTNIIIILLVIIASTIFISLRNKNKLNRALDTMNKTIKMQNSIITKQRDDSMNLLIVAEEAKETKMRLFTDISHEFRSVVTLITNPINNLITTIGDETIIKKLEIIQRSSERLKRLSSEILKFQKIDANKYQLTFYSSNIAKFITNIVETFYQQAEFKKIKLVTEIPQEIYAEFDLEVIEKITCNLLSNALKYTNEYGTITVSVKLEYQKVSIKVNDTGLGIPESELPFIFNRFFKVSNALNIPEYDGTGIGLALSKELIQLHNGQIDVYSYENKGTTFFITIPQYHLVKEYDHVEKANKPIGVKLEHFQDHDKEKTVLIVEDNPDLQVVISDIVRKAYNVITAYNGKEGLAQIQAQFPDIIVSDILMPVMDGMQMCIEIKRNPNTCHIPVIMLTALDSQDTTLKCFDIGADAYITKPFNEFLLLSRIRNLLESREKLKMAFYPSQFAKDIFKTKDTADEEFVQKCLEHIYENIEKEEFNLDALAEKMNMSRSSLYRKLKDLGNLKPIDFIKKAKLNYAAKLLLSRNLPVNVIAWRSGFSDTKYFSKCFFSEYGCYPKNYSEMFLNRGKVEK
jgi:signal transduction histidine kinase/DNA-binding response OmpR family regulator/cellobiose-specific phosphotransferase system component IIB